jgi:hypothetical protein
MNSIWAWVFLFSISLVQGLAQCSKENSQVNIKLVSTVTGGYTRYWQLNTNVGNQVCHEIGKKLKYETTCTYGIKSHNCQCTGSWANEQGVNSRIAACNSILPGQLVECTMD